MRTRCFLLITASLVSACTFEGLRSPGASGPYAWAGKNNPSLDQLRQALKECGDGEPVKRIDGETLDNARARAEECMFNKGFYIKSGYGGYCANPQYRLELPVCANAPARSRHSYYGQ